MIEANAAAIKVFAIEMSRDQREGLTARQRALMACIVIPQAIQQWMLDAGAVEPLLDSIEKTILAAEKYAVDSTIEDCAVAAEAHDRIGREWVSDSLWAKVMKRAGENVRALKARSDA